MNSNLFSLAPHHKNKAQNLEKMPYKMEIMNYSEKNIK